MSEDRLRTLQISSSRMEFFQDQVRILESQGVDCDTLSYPPETDDVRQEGLHDGIVRRIYGHNPLYYAYRAADFYPRILKTSIKGDYDVVHLNSGMVAPLGLLQPRRPIVLTLWGDDLLSDRLGGYQSALTKHCAERCAKVIVRSEEMAEALPCEAEIIPSGIDMSKFRPLEHNRTREQVGWEQNVRHVLFPYRKSQRKKRYPVAKRTVEKVNETFEAPVRLQAIDDVPHERMYLYYNASDALLLPSLREGSPNTVKEAMACNLPVVSTDVGDVRDRLRPVSNSYVCSEDSELADALLTVLQTGERSDGREYLKEVSLERMGERLIQVYKSLVDETKTPQRETL